MLSSTTSVKCIQVHFVSVIATANPSQHLDDVTLQPPATNPNNQNTIYFDQYDLINVHMWFPYGQQQQQVSGYIQLLY